MPSPAGSTQWLLRMEEKAKIKARAEVEAAKIKAGFDPEGQSAEMPPSGFGREQVAAESGVIG